MRSTEKVLLTGEALEESSDSINNQRRRIVLLILLVLLILVQLHWITSLPLDLYCRPSVGSLSRRVEGSNDQTLRVRANGELSMQTRHGRGDCCSEWKTTRIWPGARRGHPYESEERADESLNFSTVI